MEITFNDFKNVLLDVRYGLVGDFENETVMLHNDLFRCLCDYDWALNYLCEYVYNYIERSNDKISIYKFLDAVIEFEYEMELFSKVNTDKYGMFEHALDIGMNTEDMLNAML